MNYGALGLPGARAKTGGVPSRTLLTTVGTGGFASATVTSNISSANVYGAWVQLASPIGSDPMLVIPYDNNGSTASVVQFAYGPSSSALTVVWTGAVAHGSNLAHWPFCVPAGQALWTRLTYTIANTALTVKATIIRNPSSAMRAVFNRKVYAPPAPTPTYNLATTLGAAAWAVAFPSWDTITPSGQVVYINPTYAYTDAALGKGASGSEVTITTASTDFWFGGLTGVIDINQWISLAYFGDFHTAQIRFYPAERIVYRASNAPGAASGLQFVHPQAVEMSGTIPV